MKRKMLWIIWNGCSSLGGGAQPLWQWKSVCIALHGTFYGFGIRAIEGTDYTSVLEYTTVFTWEKIPGEDDRNLKNF